MSQPEAVAGCKLLNAVTAIGYTSRSGIVYDTGTPAITVLQAKADSYGANTLQLTSNTQSSRYGFDLTTLKGNAYSCDSPAAKGLQGVARTATPIPPHPSNPTERGNATIRIRPTILFLSSGQATRAPNLPEWITVDADIEGNHVLAYYDFTLQDERILLEGCWLNAALSGQCRQREADGAIALFDVYGQNLRVPDGH